MRTARSVAVCLVIALVSAGCGIDPPTDVVTPTVAPAITTTTTLPPGGRQPVASDPLRVILAGDSMMAELASAAIDALARGGSTEAKFVLSPGVSLTAAHEVVWRHQLDTFDPDVIVVLVGTWELIGGVAAPGEPGWRARYDSEILDPFVSMVTSGGAELVWVGMPAVANPESTFQLAELNAAYANLPARFDAVTYIAGGEYLSAPTGGYAEFLDGLNGPLRVRRTDGLHLCPEGARRLAEPVLSHVVARWNVAVANDWRSGDWRRPPILVNPEECPPV